MPEEKGGSTPSGSVCFSVSDLDLPGGGKNSIIERFAFGGEKENEIIK